MISKMARPTAESSYLVAPEKLRYSKLYHDFLQRRPSVTGFFPVTDVAAVAEQVDRVDYPRDRMADVLHRQNESFGASRSTLDRIDQLRDPRAVCLFSGQQAGLFGGPLLTLVKALATVKAARLYAERLDRPVLPMFWIAGDDHDFEEAAHTFVMNRRGEPVRAEYSRLAENHPPVADIKLDDPEEWDRLRDLLHEALGESEFTGPLYEALADAYTPDDTLVSGFGKLMGYITRNTGLILFNPADNQAKRLAEPFLRAMVDRQDQLHDELADTERRLRQAGYHLQVEKNPAAASLFYHADSRVPILRRDDGFMAGEKAWTRSQLLAETAAHPERFSPDALTRPIMQSFLFPVVSQKCGPSEIAYMAQLIPLFDLLERPTPVHVARATLTIVEKRVEQFMNDMAIAFEDLTGDVEQVVNRVLGESFPVDLQQNAATLRESIERHFTEFTDRALGFDPGQRRNAEQVRGKIDYLLKGFEAKLFAAHKKKSHQMRERVYRVANAVFPQRELQERSLNICSFLARYGTGIVDYLLERIDCEETSHQLIFLSEYEA